MLKAFAGGAMFGAVHGSMPAPVLALPGWARTHRDFDAVLAGLDAVALDLPGFGASPAPPEAWGGAGYAAAVASAVFADLDRPAVVVGHSFGGRVAVHLAAAFPDAVAGLVLTGVPLLRPVGQAARRPALGYRLGRVLHRRGLIPDARMEALRQRYGSADYKAAQGVMRAVHVWAVNETYEAELDAVSCPVELVWGGRDTAAGPAVAALARDRLRAASLHVEDGADHMLPLSHPAVLRAAVDRLLARRQASA